MHTFEKMGQLQQIEKLLRTHEATIPPDYLDEMDHMNVMWYMHLFSKAMVGTFRLVGIDRSYMEANEAGIFALEGHIRYLSEIRVGHRVAIYSRLIDRSAKRIHVVHFMMDCDKVDLAATFEAIATHTDMTIRRSSPFPQQVADKLDQLLAEHKQLDWTAPTCGVMQP